MDKHLQVPGILSEFLNSDQILSLYFKRKAKNNQGNKTAYSFEAKFCAIFQC